MVPVARAGACACRVKDWGRREGDREGVIDGLWRRGFRRGAAGWVSLPHLDALLCGAGAGVGRKRGGGGGGSQNHGAGGGRL